MRVLVAMSGGVDSSVAAAVLCEEGHEVVGATMKLWGGPSDSGCCSVADVEDARRVAQQLGIDHHVFNFSSDFDRQVVAPYVTEHAAGRTPNPCVECNRHLKFDRFARRAAVLGFDAIATGHHARVERGGAAPRLMRGMDPAKDQSYVLHMLTAAALRRVLLPVGEMTKAQVRAKAAELGLRTAAKPDSQDVCFIPRAGGRSGFLAGRMALRGGRMVDEAGADLGGIDAVQLVTVGQRRGLGLVGKPGPASAAGGDAAGGGDARRYVLDVDVESATVTVGPLTSLMVDEIALAGVSWVNDAPDDASAVELQCSAHGRPVAGRWRADRCAGDAGRVDLDESVRRVARSQSAVMYRGDEVLGGGTVL